MRHLYALGATAALVLAASEAGAQVREVVLFPNVAAPQTAAAVPTRAAPPAKVLSWAGKRENRYSPRTSAPGRPAEPIVAAVQPAPVTAQPIAVAARPQPVPQPTRGPIIGSAPTPDMDFDDAAPAPAAQASLYVPVPVYAPLPTPRSIYDAPPPQTQRLPYAPQPVAAPVVRPRPEPMPAAQPALKPAPQQTVDARPTTRPAPQPAAPQPAATAAAAAPQPAPAVQTSTAPLPRPAAVSEPWRGRAGDNGPRVYSVHRQFGLTPDPAQVSVAPNTKAAEPLPSEFFLAGRSPAEPDADEVAATEESPIVQAKPERQRRRSNR